MSRQVFSACGCQDWRKLDELLEAHRGNQILLEFIVKWTLWYACMHGKVGIVRELITECGGMWRWPHIVNWQHPGWVGSSPSTSFLHFPKKRVFTYGYLLWSQYNATPLHMAVYCTTAHGCLLHQNDRYPALPHERSGPRDQKRRKYTSLGVTERIDPNSPCALLAAVW